MLRPQYPYARLSVYCHNFLSIEPPDIFLEKFPQNWPLLFITVSSFSRIIKLTTSAFLVVILFHIENYIIYIHYFLFIPAEGRQLLKF